MTDVASVLPGSSPWRRIDRLGLLATTGAGAVLIAVSWFGAADATSLATQVRWMNSGVVGVIVLGAGNALWFLTGRRAAGRLRRSLIGSPELARRLAVPSQRVDRQAAEVAAPVAGKDLTRYHRPDCPLVAGRSVTASAVGTHVRRGRRPCGVCLPDGAAHLRSAAGE